MMTNCYQRSYWQIRRLALYKSLLLSASVDQNCCRYIPVLTCPLDILSFCDLLLSFPPFFLPFSLYYTRDVWLIRWEHRTWKQSTPYHPRLLFADRGQAARKIRCYRLTFSFVLFMGSQDRTHWPRFTRGKVPWKTKIARISFIVSTFLYCTKYVLYFLVMIFEFSLNAISYQDTRTVLADYLKTLRLANLLKS